MSSAHRAGAPDYTRLRAERPFEWYVVAPYTALLAATGIPIRDHYLDPRVGIELYRRGRPLVREIFGPDLLFAPVATPHISYGHINALGVQLRFPEGGEVNYERDHRSLPELIRALEEGTDFSRCGMAPFYLEYLQELRDAFPGEQVQFTFGAEGPMTTAYELRDLQVFLDPFDDPPLFQRFLRAVTASIVEYRKFTSRVNRLPEVSPEGGGICDDVAAMFGPPLWETYVVPSLEHIYRAVTSGKRGAHIEDLTPEQLRFLEQLGLSSFDPSISPRLDPRILSRLTRVPFGWRLGSFHYHGLSEQEVRDFVYQAAADGASSVFSNVCWGMLDDGSVRKVRAFIEAARETKRLLDSGAPRSELARMVSEGGRRLFWDQWPRPRTAGEAPQERGGAR